MYKSLLIDPHIGVDDIDALTFAGYSMNEHGMDPISFGVTLAAGLTGKDDTLPKRLLEEPAPSGAAAGRVSERSKMLPEYYELRGWTPEGVPRRETLQRLGLA